MRPQHRTICAHQRTPRITVTGGRARRVQPHNWVATVSVTPSHRNASPRSWRGAVASSSQTRPATRKLWPRAGADLRVWQRPAALSWSKPSAAHSGWAPGGSSRR